MESFQNKNLIELFQLGIALNDQKQEALLKKVALFSPQFAKELKKMFAANPSQIGLSGALNNIKQNQNDISAMHIPKVIGKFKIISILGFGGMGMVFLGKREDINQIVAVKVAHSSKPDSTKTQAITSEAKILASLQHPNIASLVDWGKYENGHYVATEFVDGTTIANYCEEHDLTIKQRISLMLKIIDAVEFAHDNLIIHRDIKPSNIMVDDAEEPILIDFGVARLMESETAEHQQTIDAALTPSYASPEQRTGKSLSIRSDIYSLGAVLLNLVTDKQIDKQKEQSLLPTIEKMIDEDKQQNKAKWHKITKPMRKDLSLILAKALSHDPKQRYPNAFSFKKDLQSLLRLKPISAHEPSRWYWFKKFIARNRLVTSILAVTLMATVFGGWQWKEAVEVNEELKTYSKLLENTLQGMNSYQGGGVNITMEEFMKRAVKIYKENEDVSHRQMSYHAQTLSKIYNSWGKFNEELEILKIGISHAIKTSTPLDEILFLGQKAVTLHNLTKYELAIETAKKAIEIADKYPDLRTQKLGILNYQAHSLLALEKYNEASEIFKLMKNSPKSTQKNIAFSYYGLATIQMDTYAFENSIENFKISEKLFMKVFGKNTGFVLMVRALILYLETLSDPSSLNQNAYEDMTKTIVKMFGENHSNTAEFIQMKAHAYSINNQYDKAIIFQQQALLILESKNLSEYILRNKLPLIKFYLLDNKFDLALDTMNSITDDEFATMTRNSLKAEYHNYKFLMLLHSNSILMAKNELIEANQYVKGTENVNGIIENIFRTAQLSALEKDYQACYDNAQKATEMADKLYPKTWQLPNAYRYLQDVCQQKLKGTENQEFPYLQAVLDSPWKQETVITTKILNAK